MKKRQLSISEYENPMGTYTITINNARYYSAFFEKVVNVFKFFITDSELFFGFYRIDGLNLTFKQQKELKKEIPLFFEKNGEYKSLNEYLAVAKAKGNDCTYNFLPYIFDYYLETIFFTSNVSWDFFEQYHFEYIKHRYDDYILNGLAEFLFCYFDSGDFSVCFNPKKYNPREVRTIIDKFVIEKSGDGYLIDR